jgi:hypothetical protein
MNFNPPKEPIEGRRSNNEPPMQYAVNHDGSKDETFKWAGDGRKARASVDSNQAFSPVD